MTASDFRNLSTALAAIFLSVMLIGASMTPIAA